jgi:Esterase PHB depolymerase
MHDSSWSWRWFGVLLLACLPVGAAVPALPRMGADLSQTTVSGLSSGGFMAVQLQVAYSSRIAGAGVVAGGPYYCALNSALFIWQCMGQNPLLPPNARLRADFARDRAADGRIDPLRHLGVRRIYVYSGTQDTIVRPLAVDATVAFFQEVGVPSANLRYVNDIPSGHALITAGQGRDCADNASPYINQCEVQGQAYDQAGALLTHLLGALQPPSGQAQGTLLKFRQRGFAPASSSMAAAAYLYVPPACQPVGSRCRVHVALHGCAQSVAKVGEVFLRETGYNRWADTNRMLVLYPQVDAREPSNPQGCWDWWGYTDSRYADKAGVQPRAIMAMVRRLGLRRPGEDF